MKICYGSLSTLIIITFPGAGEDTVLTISHSAAEIHFGMVGDLEAGSHALFL